MAEVLNDISERNMLLQGILEKYLLELLLSLVLTFNVAAYKLLWNKISEIEDDAERNAESVDVILNRIFGIDEDPTDEGYIMESEKRFDTIAEKLEEISEKQDKHRDELKEEHEHVDAKVSSIIQVLAKDEKIDVEEGDFEDES